MGSDMDAEGENGDADSRSQASPAAAPAATTSQLSEKHLTDVFWDNMHGRPTPKSSGVRNGET
jgi:hypothetical protein